MVDKQTQGKEKAAAAAVHFVRKGTVLGLGSGSTVEIFLKHLREQVEGGLRLKGVVAASRRIEGMVRSTGIPLVEERPDVVIDGADEVDEGLRMIKGGGGALLREKILMSTSPATLILVDHSKMVQTLGSFPLPVEIFPFGASWTVKRLGAALRELGYESSPRLRMESGLKPFFTDNGNLVYDCPLGRLFDPEALAGVLDGMVGVAAHGLFLGLADGVLVGGEKLRTLGSFAEEYLRGDTLRL